MTNNFKIGVTRPDIEENFADSLRLIKGLDGYKDFCFTHFYF